MSDITYKKLSFVSLMLFGAIFCLPKDSHAADGLSVSASVNSTLVPMDTAITYTITVEGETQDTKVSMPPWKGLTQIGQPRVSRSSSGNFFSFSMTKIVNGKVVTNESSSGGARTAEYVYTLQAVSPGTHVLGPVTVKDGNKESRSEPIEVRVLSARVQEAPIREEFSNVQGDIYIDAWIDRSEIYKGQQATYVLTLFYARDIDSRGIEYTRKPEFDGFLTEEAATRDPYRLRSGKTEYRAYEIARYSLTPVKDGELTVNPVGLGLNVIVSRSFFNQRTKRYEVTSDSVKVNVKPLPDGGKPASFGGAVGSFEMEASVSPMEVKVGEPVTVRINIFGKGNIDSIGFPTLATTKGFSEYEPESSVSKTAVAGEIFGEKHVEMLLSPMSVESKRIPEVRFSYFEPATGQYKTLAAGPFDISVTPAPTEQPTVFSAMQVAGPERHAIIVKNILANYKGSLGAGQGPARPLGNSIVALLLACPAILYVLTALTLARRYRYATDVAFARGKSARKAARRRLVDARELLEADDGQFYPGLAKSLTTFLADRLNVPAGGLTVADCQILLYERGVEPVVVDEFTFILESCDMGSFAGAGHDKTEKKRLLEKAENCIERLESTLGKTRR
ncbi:BatD family protein [Candidatus Hydrogenedentota bacterium]